MKSIIRITKNHTAPKVVLIALTCIFVPVISYFVYLGVIQGELLQTLIASALVVLNVSYAVHIVFNDYTVLVDRYHNQVLIKRRDKVLRFDPGSFVTFKIEYINQAMSLSYRYYCLVLNGKKYRVRYYTDEVPGMLSGFYPKKEAQKIETAMKEHIRKYLPDTTLIKTTE